MKPLSPSQRRLLEIVATSNPPLVVTSMLSHANRTAKSLVDRGLIIAKRQRNGYAFTLLLLPPGRAELGLT